MILYVLWVAVVAGAAALTLSRWQGHVGDYLQLLLVGLLLAGFVAELRRDSNKSRSESGGSAPLLSVLLLAMAVMFLVYALVSIPAGILTKVVLGWLLYVLGRELWEIIESRDRRPPARRRPRPR